MFYSHQLLARKAPLGQIWMAATMHAKINRRKLDKLDIIQICEEILNPSVPMALRLSSILMGGVVIVYERKVKLLYDDVTRFLIEINESWRVKTVADRTVLPKAKVQAKYEAVTLPEDEDTEEVEKTMRFPDAFGAGAARFERMRLEDLEEHYINIDIREEDLTKHHHQADAANITLLDDYSSHLGGADIFNRFERFDIDEDDETQLNFSQVGQPEIPTTLRPSATPEDEQQPRADNGFIPSPPPQPEMPQDTEAQPHQVEENEEEKPKAEDLNRQRKTKRKTHGTFKHLIMDNEQLMIPGNIYQNWLQSSSDIVSKRGRTVKECLQSFNPLFSTKVDNLMDLPPVALISGLDIYTAKLHYPPPLMTQWRKCTSTNASSPSGDTSAPEGPEQQQEPQSPSPVRRHGDLPEFPQEFQTEKESNPLEFSIEKLRANLENVDLQRFDDAFSSDHYVTPGNSGRSANSTSSGSGNTFMALDTEIRPTSGRSKRRQNSSSRNNLGNLDPVEEEFPLQQDVRGFKIRRLSEDGPTPDLELLVETGPTQTPPYRVHTDHSNDQITQSIRTHLKTHFDTPGAPQFESLSHLALGMNERQAAKLFYQTCVLATFDFIKVEQAAPYMDIIISRGPKM